MGPSECFRTKNTCVRKLKLGDEAFLFRLETDPEVKRFLAPPVSGRTQDDYRRVVENPTLEFLLIELRDTLEPVGRCGLFIHWMPEIHRETEIHVAIAKEFWGRHLGPEVALELRDYARRLYPEKPITAKVHPLNRRSLDLVARLGLRYVGDVAHQGQYDHGWRKFAG